MTGEISLRGNVLPIGGLKEKTMAAYSAGVHTVLIPEDNMQDLENIDPVVRESLKFVPCKRISDVLSAALVEKADKKIFISEAKAEEYPDIIPESVRGRATITISR